MPVRSSERRLNGNSASCIGGHVFPTKDAVMGEPDVETSETESVDLKGDPKLTVLFEFAEWVSKSETLISFSERHNPSLMSRKVEEFWRTEKS